MPLVLHVLGPAFDLPSIDAECIASIALLKLRFGHDQETWMVRSTHASPDTLPLLIDGDKCISGFSSICYHLQTLRRSDGLDADALATTALIQARAPVLIAAYLYLSYENYSTTTRPAFTPILPLYARFLVPSALRAAAKESTKQFGIAGLDIEALDDKHASPDQKLSATESTFESSAKNRASLLLPKVKTVRSLLAQKPETMAAFKLQNMADALLEPLKDLLGDQDFFTGHTDPGQVDCIAYAYLALMLKPNVPQQWLSKIVRERYPTLSAYVKRMESCLGFTSGAMIKSSLPWTVSVDISLREVLADISNALRDQSIASSPATVISSSAVRSPFWSRHLPASLLIVGSAMVASACWALLPFLTTPHGNPIQIFGGRRAADLSHLSNALAGLNWSMPNRDRLTETHVVNNDATPAGVGIEIES